MKISLKALTMHAMLFSAIGLVHADHEGTIHINASAIRPENIALIVEDTVSIHASIIVAHERGENTFTENNGILFITVNLLGRNVATTFNYGPQETIRPAGSIERTGTLEIPIDTWRRMQTTQDTVLNVTINTDTVDTDMGFPLLNLEQLIIALSAPTMFPSMPTSTTHSLSAPW